tara:strand:- start:97 stop:462 length:366 start_codon:yes stop_codon:yes gene_type:complete
MIEVPISIGELYDKISILEIKVEKGLDAANKELELLTEISQKLYTPIYVEGLYKALKSINSHLWIIEDMKREKESDNEFDDQFIEIARAVYILNDQRAHLKKLINKHMDSKIEEHKSYEEY